MPKPIRKPPFGTGPQGQPAAQAAPANKSAAPLRATHALAERHEALWLSLTALHKDIVTLGAKQPGAAVSEPVRIAAEGLLADGLPFTRQRHERFPVAAADLGGLAVQLGQALAGLEHWESLNTSWDERYKCRIWRVSGGYLPLMRLKPPALALKHPRTDMADLRDKLAWQLDARTRGAYQEGFEAGRAARTGAPNAAPSPRAEETARGAGEGGCSGPDQTYPRLSPLG